MKYEIRIFAGPQGKPRQSKNFTIDSDLPLHDIAEGVKKAVQNHDMTPARKTSLPESKERM